VNTVPASFNTVTGQMTKMSRWKSSDYSNQRQPR